MHDAEWFRTSIIYQIFIDRFAGFRSTEHWEQPVFIGGNIRGIIDKLPYLADLGVDTLWISPFLPDLRVPWVPCDRFLPG